MDRRLGCSTEPDPCSVPRTCLVWYVCALVCAPRALRASCAPVPRLLEPTVRPFASGGWWTAPLCGMCVCVLTLYNPYNTLASLESEL